MNPLRRLFPTTHRGPQGRPVRPAGAIDDEVGLLLRALPSRESAQVYVDGVEVEPRRQEDGSALVGLAEAERHRLEIRSVGAVQAAWVTVKQGPPRVLSYALIPTTEVFGASMRVTAPARVNLVNFPVSADVLVDGVSPPREAVEWSGLGRVRTFRVDEGRHTFEVRRGLATGLLLVGVVTVDVAAGEILDLVQSDFPELDDGLPRDQPADAPPPVGPSKRIPSQEDLRPEKSTTFFPSQPPLSSETPRATEAPGSLEVASATPGAAVAVDGVPVAGPPFRALLAPGAHRIDVTARGYAPRTLEVRAETGRSARVQVDLSLLVPAREPTPPAPRRGRMIAIVSAGLGLATVLGVGIAMAMPKPKPPPPPAPVPPRKAAERAPQSDDGGDSS